MRNTHHLIFCLLALITLVTQTASGQILGVDFATDYSVIDLGNPTNIPPNLGGITFLDHDTLLIGGSANNANAAIYQIDVTRDPITNSINGFLGSATLYATAPNIDGGLAFGPGGVLFYTGYSNNIIGQIKPGSVAPDKVIDLNPLGVSSSVGTLQFVPSGFAGAGQLKVATYNNSTIRTITLSPDGTGTFDVTGVSAATTVSGGPEGIVYISGSNTGFGVDSMLISEYSSNSVGAYEIDANGDPILATRRNFITGLTGAEGAVIDTLTGDFLFSTFGGGNRVIVVSGFIPIIPEPSCLFLGSIALMQLCFLRRGVMHSSL